MCCFHDFLHCTFLLKIGNKQLTTTAAYMLLIQRRCLAFILHSKAIFLNPHACMFYISGLNRAWIDRIEADFSS